MSNHANNPSPLYHLSDAIFLQILKSGVNFDTRTHFLSCDEEARLLVSMSHTNQRFRNLTLHPSGAFLWSQILQPDTDSCDRFCTIAGRSADLGLSLILACPDPSKFDTERLRVWMRLAQEFRRCTSLVLKLGNENDRRPLQWLFDGAHNRLTRLILVSSGHPTDEHSRNIESLDLATPLQATPLHRFHTLLGSLNHLRSLDIIHSDKPLEDKCCAYTWLSILSHIPQLQCLRLRHAIRQTTHQDPFGPYPAALPRDAFRNLKTMEIEGNMIICSQLISAMLRAGLHPQRFVALLTWEDHPTWVQPGSHEMDTVMLEEGLTAAVSVLTGKPFSQWAFSFQAKEFGFAAASYSVPFQFLLRLQVHRPRSALPKLDRALSRSLSSLRESLGKSLEQVTSMELLAGDLSPRMYSLTFKEVYLLHCSMKAVREVYLNPPSLEHCLNPLLGDDLAVLNGARPLVPVPAATTLTIDVESIFSTRKRACVFDFLQHRSTTGKPIKILCLRLNDNLRWSPTLKSRIVCAIVPIRLCHYSYGLHIQVTEELSLGTFKQWLRAPLVGLCDEYMVVSSVLMQGG